MILHSVLVTKQFDRGTAKTPMRPIRFTSRCSFEISIKCEGDQTVHGNAQGEQEMKTFSLMESTGRKKGRCGFNQSKMNLASYIVSIYF